MKFSPIKIIILLLILVSCKKDNNIDYREEMRNFVISISRYAKNINPNFIVVPQNGQELILDDAELKYNYIYAIDGTGREDLFYGYYGDDIKTPIEDNEFMLDYCLKHRDYNKVVMVTDYCFTKTKMDSSYLLNQQYNFISFAADHRELNNIPQYPDKPFNENSDDINKLSDAKNFLYLINSENFSSKQDFINTVSQTNFDVIIMDLYHNDEKYTKSEIEKLKVKKNGSKRLVICYMSIGEAEDYRYYWNNIWKVIKPSWLLKENPEWEGNYIVKYWDKEWQKIIYGQDDSYVKKIIDSGFDGVYMDIVDGFYYFEENE
ncbi:MAG: endo alpha-1,4 polygalactosaminidase [Bacteroidales bacterium]